MFSFINRVDKLIWPPKIDSSADVSSVSPPSKRMLRLSYLVTVRAFVKLAPSLKVLKKIT